MPVLLGYKLVEGKNQNFHVYVPLFALHVILIQPLRYQNPLTLTLGKLGSMYHVIS